MPAKKSVSGKSAAGAVAGVAALAAAAAGAYYFYAAKDSAKHRKQLRGWMVKVKGEVMDRLEDMEDFSQQTYNRVVSEVLDKYKTVKKVSPAELAELGKELQGHWRAISATVAKTARIAGPAHRARGGVKAKSKAAPAKRGAAKK